MTCDVLQSRHGWGRHAITITPAHLKEYLHILFFKSQLFVLGMNCVKVSIALLLMRLATLGKYRKFLWGTIGEFLWVDIIRGSEESTYSAIFIVFLNCFTIACLCTLIFNCNPIAGAWDPEVRAKGYCYSKANFRNIGLFNTVINVTTDVMFATIPIPLIWQLQLNLRARISLIFILSLGFFASAAAIVMGVKQAQYLTLEDPTFWEEITTWG